MLIIVTGGSDLHAVSFLEVVLGKSLKTPLKMAILPCFPQVINTQLLALNSFASSLKWHQSQAKLPRRHCLLFPPLPPPLNHSSLPPLMNQQTVGKPVQPFIPFSHAQTMKVL